MFFFFVFFFLRNRDIDVDIKKNYQEYAVSNIE